MNKTKIILLAILGIFAVGVIWLIANLNNSQPTPGNTSSGIANFTIWLYQDSTFPMDEVVLNFQEKYPAYKNTNIQVESFSDYGEYTLALSSAFAKGQGPDMFVINNSDSSTILSDYAYGVDPSIVNPNDFRKKYYTVFSDDLIDSIPSETEDEGDIEYLKWIPVGYESLWIFYSRSKRLQQKDFDSISSLKSAISRLNEMYPNDIALGMWNGSTVAQASEILVQFFLFEDGVTWLWDLGWGKIKEALTWYMLFGDENGENAYNKRFADMVLLGQNNVDLFARNEIAMIAGYPRLIKEIDAAGVRKALLAAEAFPFYFNTEWATSINYNYFVRSKQSENGEMVNDFFQYLTSDSWAETFLDEYEYYLPALLSLEEIFLDEEIMDGYNITLNDFYNPNHPLQSFDKWVVDAFDREIIKVIDTPNNYLQVFWEFQSKVVCQSKKYSTLTNLSKTCE